MLHAVITTIQEPTSCVFHLVERLVACGGKLIVAGDSKGPLSFDAPEGQIWPVEFLSLANQESSSFSLAEILPIKHYARKNIAYLHAIQAEAECIYETDDDNQPNDSWLVREETITPRRVVPGLAKSRWVNVYRYFSNENIWPRGLPLDEIRRPIMPTDVSSTPVRAPVQQGLVNGAADVDAIWRLVMDRDFTFLTEPSVFLAPGNWTPFNTQSTWWWPLSYPLLYIPSYCSFRMCDIWKSFVAQRCLWAMGLGLVFHAPEVVQIRNPHNLMQDFSAEIPGYENNRLIADILFELDLRSGEEAVASNLRTCYAALVAAGIFPDKELLLVDAWLQDVSSSHC